IPRGSSFGLVPIFLAAHKIPRLLIQVFIGISVCFVLSFCYFWVYLRPRKLAKQSCYRATVPKLQMPLRNTRHHVFDSISAITLPFAT
ncbi:unnamed protein product, partial [Larinioides sclopetarius]